MKTKMVILAVLVILLVTSLNTGCFDTANHTKVSIVAYSSDGTTFDGEYNIILHERFLIGQETSHSKAPAKGSTVYNFTLKNGDWYLHIDKEKIIALETNPADIVFETNDKSGDILIILLVPLGGTADDVHTENIIVRGARTKSVEE